MHCKDILKGCIYQRFPDVVDFNFDLVKVHWSISAIEPVVNHARYHYVLAVFEEELKESIVVLKLDLPPYVEIGAIFVPLALTKRRLIAQTGIDMVCGPEGELYYVCAITTDMNSSTGMRPLPMMEISLSVGLMMSHHKLPGWR